MHGSIRTLTGPPEASVKCPEGLSDKGHDDMTLTEQMRVYNDARDQSAQCVGVAARRQRRCADEESLTGGRAPLRMA